MRSRAASAIGTSGVATFENWNSRSVNRFAPITFRSTSICANVFPSVSFVRYCSSASPEQSAWCRMSAHDEKPIMRDQSSFIRISRMTSSGMPAANRAAMIDPPDVPASSTIVHPASTIAWSAPPR